MSLHDWLIELVAAATITGVILIRMLVHLIAGAAINMVGIGTTTIVVTIIALITIIVTIIIIITLLVHQMLLINRFEFQIYGFIRPSRMRCWLTCRLIVVEYLLLRLIRFLLLLHELIVGASSVECWIA